MLNGLDLFSGIGGLTLALAPWVRPVAYCENDRFAQGVLLSQQVRRALPIAPIWDDIRTLRARELPKVDVVYGGFPCQDISTAGLGKGLEGKRSGLVFEVFRLVNETRPSFVFLENVPAIRTRGGERVVKELAALRYDCRWDVLSAFDVGAPHKRDRWWLLAHAVREGRQISGAEQGTAAAWRRRPAAECDVQTEIWNPAAAELRRIPDGVRPASHRIRALGNAVVPAQAREAFRRLMGLP